MPPMPFQRKLVSLLQLRAPASGVAGRLGADIAASPTPRPAVTLLSVSALPCAVAPGATASAAQGARRPPRAYAPSWPHPDAVYHNARPTATMVAIACIEKKIRIASRRPWLASKIVFLLRYSWLDVSGDALLIQSWSTVVAGPIFIHGMSVTAPARVAMPSTMAVHMSRISWRAGSMRGANTAATAAMAATSSPERVANPSQAVLTSASCRSSSACSSSSASTATPDPLPACARCQRSLPTW